MGYGSGTGAKQESEIGINQEYRQILSARVSLSLARIYLTDLENKADMGRMVDGRGSSYNASRARWISIILRLSAEAMPFVPDATAIVLARLKAACPDVIIPGKEANNEQ